MLTLSFLQNCKGAAKGVVTGGLSLVFLKGHDLWTSLVPHQPPGINYPLHKPRGGSIFFCFHTKYSNNSKLFVFVLYYFVWSINGSFIFHAQCLFPLVSRPLEDVLASLVPDESPIRGKRRLSAAVDEEELIDPAHKRLRSDEPDAPLVQEEHSGTNGNSSKLSEKDGQLVSGYPRDSIVTRELDSLRNENDALGPAACEGVPAPALCSALAGPQPSPATVYTTDVELICSANDCTSPGNAVCDPSQEQIRCSPQDPDQAFHENSKVTTAAPQLSTNTGSALQESTGASIPLCVGAQGVASPPQQSSSVTATQSAEFVSFPDKLFWSNSNNLCWLDSMLVALVNCEGLRKRQLQDQPRESSVWQLLQEYEAVCAAVQVHQQPGRG